LHREGTLIADGLRSKLMVSSSSPIWHNIDIIQTNISIVYLILSTLEYKHSYLGKIK
jgi:hypothetical protein